MQLNFHFHQQNYGQITIFTDEKQDQYHMNVVGAVPGRLPAVQQPGLPAGLPLQQPESGQPRRADHR